MKNVSLSLLQKYFKKRFQNKQLQRTLSILCQDFYLAEVTPYKNYSPTKPKLKDMSYVPARRTEKLNQNFAHTQSCMH